MNRAYRFISALVLCLAFVSLPSSVRMSTLQDGPTVAKDSIQVTAFTVNSFKGNYDNWSWLPQMKFRVNGPLESGSQLYVEFRTPQSRKEPKFFGPHVRTVVSPATAVREIKSHGGTVVHRDTGRDLAPLGNENPHICRLVVRWTP